MIYIFLNIDIIIGYTVPLQTFANRSIYVKLAKVNQYSSEVVFMVANITTISHIPALPIRHACPSPPLYANAYTNPTQPRIASTVYLSPLHYLPLQPPSLLHIPPQQQTIRPEIMSTDLAASKITPGVLEFVYLP
jgi:hypothetical protein